MDSIYEENKWLSFLGVGLILMIAVSGVLFMVTLPAALNGNEILSKIFVISFVIWVVSMVITTLYIGIHDDIEREHKQRKLASMKSNLADMGFRIHSKGIAFCLNCGIMMALESDYRNLKSHQKSCTRH